MASRVAVASINDDDVPLLEPAVVNAPKAHREKTIKNQLGTLNGCFIPCCLNIMGAVMFMRLGWATGEAGILGAVGMLAVGLGVFLHSNPCCISIALVSQIGMFITLLTAFSLSAIATNGDMGGGGSYFMISRCDEQKRPDPDSIHQSYCADLSAPSMAARLGSASTSPIPSVWYA